MKLHFTIEEHAFVQQKLAELGETKEEHAFVQQKLAELGETKEEAILKLLGYEGEQEPTEE